jgi:hypothetical protein
MGLYSDFHNDCLFFSQKKKLKFEFRSQSKTLRSLFSAFGINIVFFCAKKKDNHYGNQSNDDSSAGEGQDGTDSDSDDLDYCVHSHCTVHGIVVMMMLATVQEEEKTVGRDKL